METRVKFFEAWISEVWVENNHVEQQCIDLVSR